MIECGFGVQIPLHIHAHIHSESHFQGSVPDSGVDSGSDQALFECEKWSIMHFKHPYIYIDVYLNIGHIKLYLNVFNLFKFDIYIRN